MPAPSLNSVLLVAAAFLALALVVGLGCFRLSRDPRNRRAAALVVVAGGLAYYAARRLPPDPLLWTVLAPVGILCAAAGFAAGKAFGRARTASLEDQIAELTGEDVDWADMRPDRKPRWRR